MEEIKAKIEAVLFCNPDGIEISRLSRLVGVGSLGGVRKILEEMKEEYSEKGINIFEQDKKWKFKIRDEFSEIVKDAAIPEIDRAVLETLAFIAWKKEPTQFEISKFRSNKAYSHINELKKKGFVETKQKGKTKIVILTKKFYEYFKLKEGQDFNTEVLDSLNKN